ncbi:MAG TPA: helix-turn-helix domain-containing protein [Thermoanaerobaculia bacterium]
MSAKAKPQRQELLLRDFETLRVLADPLRLRLFEVFKQPTTAKQAAALLGEKLSRIYHHVDALSGAGLIELVDTQQKRGTVEKYYRAAAQRVTVDPAIFRTGDVAVEAGELSASLFGAALELAADETRKLAKRALEPGLEALLVHVLHNGTKADFAELRTTLAELAGRVKPSRGRTKYRLLVALYPVD